MGSGHSRATTNNWAIMRTGLESSQEELITSEQPRIWEGRRREREKRRKERESE